MASSDGYGKHVGWLVATAGGACYVLFAVAVHLRLLDNLDIAVRDASRPGAVWGPTQVRAARVVHALAPSHVALAPILAACGVSALRRSPRPVIVTVVIGATVVVVTLASKWVMSHADPRHAPIGHGAFPSGHMVSVIVVCGLVLLLVRPDARWAWLVPVAMSWVMGTALVLAQFHPATDVIGAGLLGLVVLAVATAARPGDRRPHRTSIDDASTDDTAPQLQNMPKGYSRLAELRELRAVFDTVLERHQEVLDAPRDLSAGARRRLAREALWAAGRRQKQDWPRAAGLMASRKLQWWLRHRAWRHRGV